MKKFLLIQESRTFIGLRPLISDLSVLRYLHEERVDGRKRSMPYEFKHKKIQARGMNTQGLQLELDINQVCTLGIPPPDRIESDASTITAVVIEKRHDVKYKMACKHAVLKNFHSSSCPELLPDVKMELMGLQDVYKDCITSPEISIAHAAKAKRLR